MASKRKLKKQIHNLLNNVIDECYIVMLENPGVDDDQLEAIIDDAADTMNSMITRANKGDKLGDSKAKKKHYSALRNDLGSKNLELADKLGKMSA